MKNLRRNTISTKFTLIFILTVIIIFIAGYFAVNKLQKIHLRNNASAITGQVKAFRSWIASTGVIWVNNLHPDFEDFLGKNVCNDKNIFYSKNPALATRELSELISKSDIGATFKVTSKNYRNPLNKPDPFELDAIMTLEKKGKRFIETFEGNTYRYSVPLYVTEACIKCHGKAEDAPKEVIEKYGSERAFGYKVGDIRGIITVDLPKLSFFSLLTPVINVYTISIGIIGLLLNFVLIKKVIVNRIEKLTSIAKTIEHGKVDMDLSDGYEKDSNDEIDKLYGAIQRLKEAEEERMEMQDKLIRSEKLAAVGKVAGGIGHDLRNPLNIIGNSTSYISEILKDENEQVRKQLDIIHRAVKRSSRIVRYLLDFARAKPLSPEKGNVNDVVKEALSNVERPDNIIVETLMDNEIPEIPIDAYQLQRVFINIISNAFRAMPKGGSLTIKSRVDLTPSKDQKEKGFVEVEFKDSGEGIKEENLNKIFDPLFTTRARGIGLGMVIVKDIIEKHNGNINVQSKVGRGTTFTVKLPVRNY